MTNSDLVTCPPTTNWPIKSLLLLVWHHFGTLRGKKIAHQHWLHLTTQNFAPLLIQTTAKRGASMECTLLNRRLWLERELQSMVLHIPDRFILMITSYHQFHFETRGQSSTCAWGVQFRPDPTTIFYHKSLQIRTSSTNLLPHPPPKKKFLLYCIYITQKPYSSTWKIRSRDG